MMKQWIPALKTDIRKTILSNVPEQQRNDPVFKRMAEAVHSGSPIHIELPVNHVTSTRDRSVR
jgi:hypothetical protein